MLPLLLVMLIAVVAAVALAGHGCQTLSRHGPGRGDPAPALRALAGLTGAAALLLYAWGALAVAGAVLEAEDGGTSSAPLGACAHTAEPVVGYSVAYVPLRFVCETAGARQDVVSDTVPGYVNPGVAALGGTAAGCAVAAGFAGERRVRSRSRAGDGPPPGTV
ncbi:hypothetical protein AB0K80_08880 [Streptomyces sp. NPDC052682]|uniref:hypothetical protein n=1 Tax=Streptomyces sp. NPDC052682 TaxID=3154954 RepID=UPI00341C534E